jgi:hypothetical protein
MTKKEKITIISMFIVIIIVMVILGIMFLQEEMVKNTYDKNQEEVVVKEVEFSPPGDLISLLIKLDNHPSIDLYYMFSSKHGIRFGIEFEEPVSLFNLEKVTEIKLDYESYSELQQEVKILLDYLE